MWADACALLREAEHLQRQFGAPGRSLGGGRAWEPPVDIFEDGFELLVRIALPGVAPEQIEIEIEPGWLTVRAERALGVEPRRARIRQLEIPHGHFERRIALPVGRYDVRGRDAVHGCVALRLHKRLTVA